MGKKIQALKEAFPCQWPKFSLPKISRPKLPRPSDAEQLVIWALILFLVGWVGASLVAEISGLAFLGLIPITIGAFCYLWFLSAIEKL